MSWGVPDDLDRTAKVLMDSGRAQGPDEAREYLERLVLQVAVGDDIGSDRAAQAALATVTNVGRRAFLGGVHVRLERDTRLGTGWTTGLTATETVERYGGTMVTNLDPQLPTLVIGNATASVGRPVLHCGWRGWTAERL